MTSLKAVDGTSLSTRVPVQDRNMNLHSCHFRHEQAGPVSARTTKQKQLLSPFFLVSSWYLVPQGHSTHYPLYPLPTTHSTHPHQSLMQRNYLCQQPTTQRKFKSSCHHTHTCGMEKILPFFTQKIYIKKLCQLMLERGFFNSLLVAICGESKIFNRIYKGLNDLSNQPPQLQQHC